MIYFAEVCVGLVTGFQHFHLAGHRQAPAAGRAKNTINWFPNSGPADTADLTRYQGTSRLCSDDEQFTNHTTLARGKRPDYGEEYRSQQLEAVGL